MAESGSEGLLTRAEVEAEIRAADRDADAAGAPAAPVEPCELMTGVQAVEIPSPDPVISVEHADFSAAVCSVGEPAILTGAGGAGKGWYALLLAIAAAKGAAAVGGVSEVAGGMRVRRGPVVFLSYEDRVETGRMGERLRIVGSHPACGPFLHFVTRPVPLFAPAGASSVSGAVAAPFADRFVAAVERVQPSLVIVDPLSAAAGGANLNEGGAARLMMDTFASWSADTGAGFLVLAHDTKGARDKVEKNGDPKAGAVSGSGQLHDGARGVVYLTANYAKTGRKVSCVKANHGPGGWSIEVAERRDGLSNAWRGLGDGVVDVPDWMLPDKRPAATNGGAVSSSRWTSGGAA